ncbi:hypothetical protein HS088_TW05G00209 [Tripterygium wilfordii]|uniref:Uncharacterized protein n=1 Tax=Tripterygium wilfordii TaxID=458696 RepID=A0A7J7DMD8_TRIWF|nr:uncharacterized protein LOC119999007 [Tripterygium wilfordii]KAF5747488.1 hypothetical protein HS088_TW05G00209 [Tripterygium wilfordii]
MALTPKLLLRPSTLFALFVIVAFSVLGSATARPGCKTFFIAFTTTIPARNPNLPHFLTISDQLVEIHRKPAAYFEEIVVFPTRFVSDVPQFPADVEKREIEHSFGSFGYSSLRKPSKDILNVVFSLLLGVACGALTSATMYLIWCLMFHRGEHRILDSDSSDDDDLYNPKKMGYVKVPAAPADAAPKEAVSGN